MLSFTFLIAMIASGCAPKLIGSKAAAAAAAAGAGSSSGGSSAFAVTSEGLKGFQIAGPADLNRDGSLDLVFADTDSNDVVVKTSDNAGGWNADVTYSPTGIPIGMTFGDINKDGRSDLFVTLSTGGVDVLLRGAANYGAAINYAAGTATAGVVTGDFNNDGTLDVIATGFAANVIYIMTGNAVGTLNAATPFAAGTAPVGITAADFNHDGNLDVAFANSGSDQVSVRLGTGIGGFGGITSYNVGDLPLGVAHGDFNRDGDIDLAVANHTSGTVSILLGDGTGGMGAAASVTVGTNPVNLAVGDLNVDGVPDLVVANYGSNNASKLLGVGNGTFAAAVNTATSNTPLAVAIGDFDRSGEPDAAITEQADTTPTLITGTDPAAPATFNDGGDLALGAGGSPLTMAAGDFDNDGDADLAVPDMANDRVRIFFNDGAGVLTQQQDVAIGAGDQAAGVAVGDVDRDGDLDLVVAERSGGQTLVFKNNGAGAFGAVFDTIVFNAGGGGNAFEVKLADADGDGDLDAYVIGVDFANEGVFDIYSNDGTGDLSLLDTIVSAGGHESSRNLDVGDIDNDGDIDVVFSVADDNELGFALNNGSGIFPANATYITTGAASGGAGIHLVDLNRDGYLDVVIAGSGAIKEAMIMTNNGAASFNAVVTYDSPLGTASGRDMLPLDADFDGDFDFFMAHQDGVAIGATGVELLLGNGNTGMAHSSYAVGSCDLAQYGVVVDFNRDGRPDVAVGCEAATNVSLYFAN